MKEKLLIITASGASIPLGFPSIKKIDELFCETAKMSPLSKNTNLYEELKRMFPTSSGNYEKMLYIMRHISSISYGSTLRDILQEKFDEDLRNRVGLLRAELLTGLFKHFCEKANSIDNPKFNDFKVFLNSLEECFDLSFITTNHDNIISLVYPEHITGFDINKPFDAKRLLDSKNWRFNIPLHGSIHFNMKPEQKCLYKIHWTSIEESKQQNFMGHSSERTDQYLWRLNIPFIEGGDKLNQMFCEPFFDYLYKSRELLNESNRILIIGYGFGDMHLNKLISDASFENKKIFIIDKKDYPYGNSCDYEKYDDWIRALSRTITYNVYEPRVIFKDKQDTPIIDANQNITNVEYSECCIGSNKTRIFYNGLEEAYSIVDEIKKFMF